MFKKKNFNLYIFLFGWFSLWASINTHPGEFNLFGTNIVHNINSIRIGTAIFISFLLISIALFNFTKIKMKKIDLLFILYFLSQIFGLTLNYDKNFNLEKSYLAILGIGTIILFHLIYFYEKDKIKKYFFHIVFFFIIVSLLINVGPKISDINNFNFYKTFDEQGYNYFQRSSQRITGISRMIAIISLFIFLFALRSKKKFRIILDLILIFFTIIILLMQSRGTILCYFGSFLITILFFIDHKKNKIKYFIIMLIIPILSFSLINKNILNNKTTLVQADNMRITSASSSGRLEIWNYTVQNYNFKNIFGYGPNGDRFFLKDFDKKNKYGDNISNIFLYSLVSGGIISLIFIILIWVLVFKEIYKKIKIILKTSDIYFQFSIICIFYFAIRSLFENSFGLFSTDFLITYLSIDYVTKYNDHKRKT